MIYQKGLPFSGVIKCTGCCEDYLVNLGFGLIESNRDPKNVPAIQTWADEQWSQKQHLSSCAGTGGYTSAL